MPVRINPFTPSHPLPDAGLFAGRVAELQRGYQFVVQVANENPRHMLVTGPRGIGKSSLALAVISMARGEEQYLKLLDTAENPSDRPVMIAPFVAQEGQVAADIVAEWVAALKRQTSITRGMSIDEAEVSILVARFKVRRADEHASLAGDLIEFLKSVLKGIQDTHDGIVLYADELDQIANVPGVASLLKVTTELLAHAEIRNVALLVVGQSWLSDDLATGHASARRLFEHVDLVPLSDDDVKDLVETGLIGTHTTIAEPALTRLVEVSQGFPSRAQLLAYEVFEEAGRREATSTPTGLVREISVADVNAVLATLKSRGELEEPTRNG